MAIIPHGASQKELHASSVSFKHYVERNVPTNHRITKAVGQKPDKRMVFSNILSLTPKYKNVYVNASHFICMLPCRCSCCWLLPIGGVGRLGAISRWGSIRSLGGGNCGGGCIISSSAVTLDRLAISLGSSWGGIACNKKKPY